MGASRQQDILRGGAAVFEIVLRFPAYNNDTCRGISNEPSEVGGVGNAAQRLGVCHDHKFPWLDVDCCGRQASAIDDV